MPTSKRCVVTFGEVMLRLSPPGFQRFRQANQFDVSFGGGEANVAVSLAQLGISARYVTRLPENDMGVACAARLKGLNVDVDNILWGGARLGIYFMEYGSSQRPSKVIYDRAASSFATLQPGMIDWETVFSGCSWFHWTGITPAISESAAATCQEALEVANKLGITISCDLNYRSKLWNWTDNPQKVMEKLVEQCQLVIGNEEDAEKIFGIKPKGVDYSTGNMDSEKYKAVCLELARKIPSVTTVAITLRGSKSASDNTWAAVMLHNGTYYSSLTYEIIPIVDRVGGGDAFAGGLIYSMLTNSNSPQAALDFALATSCLKHTLPGDFNYVTLDEVEKLVSGDKTGRIAR